jgi:mannose-6-phosphate isomerase-like protein (cupin superfamily)
LLIKKFTKKEENMRRVVTGQKNGKSVVLEDAKISGQGVFGSEFIGVWETKEKPTIPLEDEDQINQPAYQFPEPGGTLFAVVTLPPDEVIQKNAEKEGIDPDEHWRKLYNDEPGMHTTDTIDYCIILSGEIWMEVDDGVEVHLKPGDCVIQNGTRHAWRNKSSKNCVAACALIGAKRK